MNCPKCSAEFPAGDAFCMSCGADLRAAAPAQQKPGAACETTADGRTVLGHADLAALAAGRTCGMLSPLPAYRSEGVPASQADVPLLDPDLLRVITDPRKTCCLIETAQDSFRRDLLLAGGDIFCSWQEDVQSVTLSRLKSPTLFLDRIRERLSERITSASSLHAELEKTQVKVLKTVSMLCEELSAVSRAAAFVTQEQLEALLGRSEDCKSALDGLVKQGFVTSTGENDPLFMLSQTGEETARVLSGHDIYFLLQVMTRAVGPYPSLQFAGRQGCLYLITGRKADGGLVVRALDRDAAQSLVNWAWASAAVPS